MINIRDKSDQIQIRTHRPPEQSVNDRVRIYHKRAETKGFEPLRRRTDLLDFESRPFSLLGKSPC